MAITCAPTPARAQRKKIAAVRIQHAVQREQNYESLIAQYEHLASSMNVWLDETHATFSSDQELHSIEEAEAALLKYVEYGREGKPTKFKEIMEAEVLHNRHAPVTHPSHTRHTPVTHPSHTRHTPVTHPSHTRPP